MSTVPANTIAFLSNAGVKDFVAVVADKFPGIQPFPKSQPFITKDTLAQIVLGIKPQLAQQLADVFNEVAPQYGLNRPQVFHEYISECAHESQGFTRFVENLNYSAQAMANTWPNRYAVDPKAKVKVPNALALRLERKPEAIANNCYANRMGNGSEASGDGWRFRGSGALQMTGADIMRLYAKYKGIADVAFVAEKIRTDLHWAIDSSMWVFVVNKKLLDEAEADKLDAITYAINGGYIGKEEREKIYKRAVAAMPIK
jgi:putative chitinase